MRLAKACPSAVNSSARGIIALLVVLVVRLAASAYSSNDCGAFTISYFPRSPDVGDRVRFTVKYEPFDPSTVVNEHHLLLNSVPEGSSQYYALVIPYTNNSATSDSATFVFDTAGEYELLGYFILPSGCSGKPSCSYDWATAIVHVNSPPTADFSWLPVAPHVGQAITLDASSSEDQDGEITHYEWVFVDDGTHATGEHAEFSFSSAGEHLVRLTVEDDTNSSDTITRSITVLAPNLLPVPELTFTPQSPLVGGPVVFSGRASTDSDGRIVWYGWDWTGDEVIDSIAYEIGQPDGTRVFAWDAANDGVPDGMTDIPIDFSHDYTSPGVYTATLWVRDDDGGEARVSQVVTVVAENEPPIASFAWNTMSDQGTRLLVEPRSGDLIGLDASASFDSDGRIVDYEWDWTTDGVYELSGRSAVTEHRFPDAGSYQVTLRVTDDDGGTATTTQTIGIGAKVSPVAQFGSLPILPKAGEAANFTNASSDADGQITAWSWDFGDGATSVEQNPTHTYASAGTFSVVLTVTDNDGLTGMKTLEITIAAAPAGPPRFDEQWALVIGVAEYEDPAIPNLKYTGADAQAFYDFLSDPQGGGFSNDHVRLLLNNQATTAAVKGAFRWLIQQSEEDDLVVIYFAGHGGTAPDLSQPPDEADGVDEYLVTYDARSDDLFSTAVRDDEVGDWLASFRSKNVVVILDSCFAAGSTRSLQQEGTRAGPGNQVFTDLVGAGRLFLAASREAEVSYEDAALGHGVFTYYLLLGLGAGRTSPEADVDGDGRVTVKELETYLEREVSRERNQHPLVTGDLTITRAALGGYGVPLVGEVTAIQGDTVLISLGSRHGVQVGDQFQVVRSYSVPGGATLAEVRALIEVVGVLDADRAACRVVQLFFPIEVKDAIRPVQ